MLDVTQLPRELHALLHDGKLFITLRTAMTLGSVNNGFIHCMFFVAIVEIKVRNLEIMYGVK